jgi:AbrB family looped-hinge helix DNA binding protein
MKALGIVRKIDDLGRLVIPKEVRDRQGWSSGQPMEMFMSDEGLVIRGYEDRDQKHNAIKILERVLKVPVTKESLSEDLVNDIKEVIAYLEQK